MRRIDLLLILVFVACLVAVYFIPCGEVDEQPAAAIDFRAIAPQLEPIPDPLPMLSIPEPMPASKRRHIVAYVSDDCDPCEDWKRLEAPKFLAADVSIEYRPAGDSLAPWFSFEWDGFHARHAGYMTVAEFKEALNAVAGPSS